MRWTYERIEKRINDLNESGHDVSFHSSYDDINVRNRKGGVSLETGSNREMGYWATGFGEAVKQIGNLFKAKPNGLTKNQAHIRSVRIDIPLPENGRYGLRNELINLLDSLNGFHQHQVLGLWISTNFMGELPELIADMRKIQELLDSTEKDAT